MKDGFFRVGTASPALRVADCAYNLDAHIAAARAAAERGLDVLLFPELSLTTATAGDLFRAPFLCRAAEDALARYITATAELPLLSFVGLPVAVASSLYNCTAAVAGGELLGLVPKRVPTAIDGRAFAPAPDEALFVTVADCTVPLSTHLLFEASGTSLVIGAEVGTDAEALFPPALSLAAGGATLIVNPAADPTLIGAAENTALFRGALSRRAAVAYLYANAGAGESGTDHVFGGEALLFSHGKLLAEGAPFAGKAVSGVIDTEALLAIRRRAAEIPADTECLTASFTLPARETAIDFCLSPTPFVPKCKKELALRAERILAIQSAGLAGRLVRAHAKKAVLGISGGLDSTLALLVAVRAVREAGLSPADVAAVTMPGFGTGARTRSNAEILCEALGVSFRTVDIKAAVRQHFADIGQDESVHDVTYENSQARERTQVLMDIANAVSGLVVGTGDLSELALGFATYNGDHMSMYGVNASIPKTLMRHMVACAADGYEKGGDARTAACLRDILATPVSPELLPPDENGEIAQVTEDIVGPYELHDFFLYHFYRHDASPRKLFRMASAAFRGVYDAREIAMRLRTFLSRFFTQQFKRSCLPDGPRTGTVALSPRGAFAMPSDASATLWLAEADAIIKELSAQ